MVLGLDTAQRWFEMVEVDRLSRIMIRLCGIARKSEVDNLAGMVVMIVLFEMTGMMIVLMF